MKIRKGFVSNSGSSSFVIVGYSLEDNDQMKILLVDTLENLTDEVLDHEKMTCSDIYNGFDKLGYSLDDCHIGKDKTFLGIQILNSNNCDEIKKIPFLEIVSKMKELSDALGVRQEPKVIMGTTY